MSRQSLIEHNACPRIVACFRSPNHPMFERNVNTVLVMGGIYACATLLSRTYRWRHCMLSAGPLPGRQYMYVMLVCCNLGNKPLQQHVMEYLSKMYLHVFELLLIVNCMRFQAHRLIHKWKNFHGPNIFSPQLTNQPFSFLLGVRKQSLPFWIGLTQWCWTMCMYGLCTRVSNSHG